MSVHEFYRLKELISLEQVNATQCKKKKKKTRILIGKIAMVAGVVNFHCIQMSLVMSMRFIFGDDWNGVHVNHFFDRLAMI